MGGLDAIYEQKEERSTLHRIALSIGLEMGITLCVIGAILAVTAARGLGGGGSAPSAGLRSCLLPMT